MHQPRVVITGIGLVSLLGRTLEEFGDALFAGKTCIVPLEESVICDERFHLGGQIKDFQFEREMPGVPAKRLYRYSQFALVAADRAISHAGLQLEQLRRERIGTSFGTAAGSVGESADESKRFAQRGDRGISPAAWSEVTWSACTTHVATHFGLCGPMASHSSGCVTGVDTLIWGAQQIREGRADVMIVGGADSPFHPFVWGLMCRSGLLSPAPDDGGSIPRPFSHDHNGIALIEGGSAVILESETHARLRGARILAEYLGGVSVNSGTGAFDVELMANTFAQVMHTTLRNAGISPIDVDWLCAHGTGHVYGDVAESKGIEYALGKHAFCIPVSSIRGAIGQPFAGGGGLQTAAACLAIQRQQVPPTINFSAPAEGCQLDYVPNVARVARVRRVLINAAGVGGIHSGIAISAYDE